MSLLTQTAITDASRALTVLIAASARDVRPSVCGAHDRNAI